VRARLVDLRGKRAPADVLDPQRYAASQAFAHAQRSAGEAGLVHDSVRRRAGQCVALFTPKATVPPAQQAEHVTLCWDGARIAAWYRKSDARLL